MKWSYQGFVCLLVGSIATSSFAALDMMGAKRAIKNGEVYTVGQKPLNNLNGSARNAFVLGSGTKMFSFGEGWFGNNANATVGSKATAQADADSLGQTSATSSIFASAVARLSPSAVNYMGTTLVNFSITNTTLTSVATCGYAPTPGNWGAVNCQYTYTTGATLSGCVSNLASGTATTLSGSNSFSATTSLGTYLCAILSDYHIAHKAYPSGATDQDIDQQQQRTDSGFVAYGFCPVGGGSCTAALARDAGFADQEMEEGEEGGTY